jgi:hypothetical protein
MKKILLFFILFFSFQVAFSQSYVPFPTQVGSQWREYYEWNYGATNQSLCEKKIYTIVGDTILDSMNYQVVQEKLNRSSSTFQNCSVLTPISANDSIYLRNDTANKKVWIRFDGNNPDTLLYDFDLKVGDTMYSLARYRNSSSSFDVVLDSIDTVTYGGIQRRRFNFKSPWYPWGSIKHVIEGIGGTHSFLNPFFEGYGWGYSDLVCFSTPSQKIYPDSLTSCRIITSLSNENLKVKQVVIFPNPTQGQIPIQEIENAELIQLYNIHGQKVKEVSPQHQEKIQLQQKQIIM